MSQIVVADTQTRARAGRATLARRVLDPGRRRRRQQRQDHREGDDRADPRAGRARASRRAAISTITSACRSRCCGSKPEHRFAVVEMGANRAGEVAALVEIARPDGRAHHQRRRGASRRLRQPRRRGARRRRDGRRARRRRRSPSSMPTIAFADLWREHDARARRDLRRAARPRTSRATDVRIEGGADGFVTRFTLELPAGQRADRAAAGGRAQRRECARRRGRGGRPRARRSSTSSRASARCARCAAGCSSRRASSGAWIIDDSYNANPSSVRAGIEVLAQLEGRKWLVLGDMAELGDFADSRAHRDRRVRARARRRAPVRARAAREARGRRASARRASGLPTRECARRRRSQAQSTRGRAHAHQGLALQPARARRRGAGRKRRIGRRALLAHTTTHCLAHGLQRLLVPDVARHPRDGLGARVLAGRRARA